MRVLQVLDKDARIVWPEIREYMAKAVKRVSHLYDVDDVLLEVEERKTILLVAEEDGKIYGAVTVRIGVFPKAKVASVSFLGGIEMKRWIDKIIKAIDVYAKECGCEYEDTVGRKGWIRTWRAKEMGTWAVRRL